MKIERFEDIIAWQKAEKLTLNLYSLLKKCSDYGFRDQLQRASVSVMNNIAEGFERNTNKELKYFLYISKGSCGEVRSMLYIASQLGYITNNAYKENRALSEEISRMLSGLIKTL